MNKCSGNWTDGKQSKNETSQYIYTFLYVVFIFESDKYITYLDFK